jgi:phosphonatase-like hydrolase
MLTIKLVVFDIAGTIIEDRGEVIAAFKSALEKGGIPFTDGELKGWKGASKREVIRHFVERESSQESLITNKVEQTYKRFRSELEDCYRGQLHPIPGAADTFAWCRERGIQLATTTGFYSEISELILDRTGWRQLFAANVSSSDVMRGRPAPFMIFHAMERAEVEDVRQVVNVGDTPLDLQAGTNAGVRGVVGVLTGSHGEDRLRREAHTHLIQSVRELPSLIKDAF